MKKVTKDFKNIPSSLISNNCRSKVITSLSEKGKHKFSTSYYASNIIKSKLSQIYNNKCAFCENDTTAGASLQVEHYRPKAKVTEDVNHPGYYWLGYEWSNLLYACSKCNRSKANFFPIKSTGTRITSPCFISTGVIDYDKSRTYFVDYLKEEPLIINPEVTCPRKHITFLPTGKIKGNTDEGKETILKCKLYRNPLVIARKKLISDVLFELKKVVDAFNKNDVAKETVQYVVKNEVLKLLKLYNNNQSFSELARTALLNFEYYFIRRFGIQKDQALLRKYFEEIKLSIE
ncbi:hypothetical protein [Zobellia galactanivorans]|uniref:hypothetical protein n=1 Tax=Zobellia galactanivorans (strain DSM 12802 / CCUG 47099 / CIP 106680 / NCIMB 13871 / Dsij) TaxID=63186 RepID=UPI001C0688B9|nr:hypothetical protein [Zobellia galactanivorans]MBU3025907.1 hypothetical protein [Zobellia galactanivorans]